jgi:hypothetical protein
MIKDKIPELQTLSTAEKFALAIELWDELASSPDEIPVSDEQLNETGALRSINGIRIRSLLGKSLRRKSFPRAIKWRLSSSSLQNRTFKRRTTGLPNIARAKSNHSNRDIGWG